jgi:hypothetical protein
MPASWPANACTQVGALSLALGDIFEPLPRARGHTHPTPGRAPHAVCPPSEDFAATLAADGVPRAS